ncbi:hypothetical protein [Geitlerinema calcuttense]|uniref:Large polyvalent protein associated domain-containing protein n=1 Tax=Geitlerinema calcuttense NRMC-F 0142 TaxID=2922238 RepID=A0ABT7LYN1_9CYAN|nr:hypothetical protein [Geitlerinema calcuttense]MDL5055906.1 hypothetical protein [Geitlerinema calcuttense NRMC-F 0142]
MLTCIPKQFANELRKQFKADNIKIADLYAMDSAGRRKLFEKSLDADTAQQANALFEKAMVSNQATALKNWIWKNLYGSVPLYTGLSIKESEKFKQKLSMADLAKMDEDARRKAIMALIDDKTAAKRIASRYEHLKTTGGLANWERRVFGTDKLWSEIKANKQLKGAFSRLEALNDLGVLTPPQMDKFMSDYVADVMGINLTAEEAAEIGAKVSAVSKAFDKVGGDWTADNSDSVINYFVKRKELETYLNYLDPEPAAEVFLDVGARGSILFSLRSLSNSIMYQIAPSASRLLIKRLSSGFLIPGDYSTIDRITTGLSGAASGINAKQLTDHVRMAMKIYAKTSYDISRMESLDDGFRYFGEKFTHTEGPSIKEAKGIKGKLAAIVRGHGKLMTPGLKWAAGGTDTLLANIHRADTSMFLGRTIAKAEQKAGTLEGSLEDRIQFLFKDSMRPDPQTDEGAYIREMGILDANHANFTNNDIYGKIAERIRTGLGLGSNLIGKTIVPFMRIPANALGVGLEMSGPGLIRGTKQLISGLQMESGNDKNIAISEGISKLLLSGGGLALAAIFVSALLDDDDYIGAYDFTRRSENALSTTKNAGANYLRIGGNWYSTRWLGPLGIPVSAMMQARQERARGRSAVVGYLAGILTGAMQFPGLKEAGEWVQSAERATRAKDVQSVASAFKATPSDIGKWLAVRTVTGTVAHDLYGFKRADRYDALGRKVPHKGDTLGMAVASFFIGTNIKEDTSNEITKEFDRLSLKNALPTLTDPAKPDDLKKAMGEDGYVEFLNSLKQAYAVKVAELIIEERYKKMSPEQQKDAIDKIRDREILKPIARERKKIEVQELIKQRKK